MKFRFILLLAIATICAGCSKNQTDLTKADYSGDSMNFCFHNSASKEAETFFKYSISRIVGMDGNGQLFFNNELISGDDGVFRLYQVPDCFLSGKTYAEFCVVLPKKQIDFREGSCPSFTCDISKDSILYVGSTSGYFNNKNIIDIDLNLALSKYRIQLKGTNPQYSYHITGIIEYPKCGTFTFKSKDSNLSEKQQNWTITETDIKPFEVSISPNGSVNLFADQLSLPGMICIKARWDVYDGEKLIAQFEDKTGYAPIKEGSMNDVTCMTQAEVESKADGNMSISVENKKLF